MAKRVHNSTSQSHVVYGWDYSIYDANETYTSHRNQQGQTSASGIPRT